MDKEQVNGFLRGCRENQGRIAYLQTCIEEMLRRKAADSERLIERNTLRGCGLDGMPRGSAPGDPTGQLAAGVADYNGSDARLNPYDAEIAALRDEMEKCRYRCSVVEAWMHGLSEKESWMIETRTFQGHIWRIIPGYFEKRFGDYYSERSLMDIYKRALCKIYRMAA